MLRYFREEESLVSKFTLEMLIVYVKSLGLAHHDEPSLGNFRIILFFL